MAKCKMCPTAIIWAKTERGANIPLQPVRTVYMLRDGVAEKSALTGVYISHFETCPKASTFSRRREQGD